MLWTRFVSESALSDKEQRDTNSSANNPNGENRVANLQNSLTGDKGTNNPEQQLQKVER